MIVLDIPQTPPSLNALGTRGSHWVVTRAKREWQQIFEGCLLAGHVQRQLGLVRASAVMRFPTRRRRDEGNYRWLLEKALGDALTNGGWLEDDTADLFRFAQLDFDAEVGAPRTLVTLTTTPEER